LTSWLARDGRRKQVEVDERDDTRDENEEVDKLSRGAIEAAWASVENDWVSRPGRRCDDRSRSRTDTDTDTDTDTGTDT
jgi:hypothetical protein